MDGRVRISFSVSTDDYNVTESKYIREVEMSKPYLDKLAAEMVGRVRERVFNER